MLVVPGVGWKGPNDKILRSIGNIVFVKWMTFLDRELVKIFTVAHDYFFKSNFLLNFFNFPS